MPPPSVPSPLLAAKKVRDPIHDYIALGPEALAVVELPVFQRLRRVRQLGTANLVYPGANHTRFEHSLGAYHLAGRAAAALRLSRADTLHVSLAALLHDVGHGPLSHLSEPAYHRRTGHSHVDETVRIVTKGPVADALGAAGADPAVVGRLAKGQGTLGALTSSDLDVDRMDYLVRDSHYTGVGTGVDLERLTSELALRNDEVVLRASALPAAEMLLVTRFMMYTTVYYHHGCRAAEVMMDRALEDALERKRFSVDAFWGMDDVALFSALRADDGLAGSLSRDVEERRLAKLALEAPHGDIPAGTAEAFERDPAKRQKAERAIAEAVRVDPRLVAIDFPPVAAKPFEAKVLTDRGDVQPIGELSALVSILDRAHLDHWRLRVFAPAAAREAAAKAAADVLGVAG